MDATSIFPTERLSCGGFKGGLCVTFVDNKGKMRVSQVDAEVEPVKVLLSRTSEDITVLINFAKHMQLFAVIFIL